MFDQAQIQEFKEAFNIFILKGANYNLQDEFGNSAMHYAVSNNSYEAVHWIYFFLPI